MQHNDIRRALCSDCKLFVLGTEKHTYKCALDGSTLRTGKHKLPLKNQSCRGPYDHIPIDELMNVTDEQREKIRRAYSNEVHV